ncbi:L30e-like protein [Lepidopterella palustris CBS 459.81]|uniref:H/ACA ribonucleoprotein complex subunit 2 n=1 Tax=Lepidopterella palustris CBS 459.81 TaxID=1314670 RepID=A0A8E2JFF3_9PEZI|nr:L30e-like protein [Lepidopterella palustris CBS 459.81]
MGKEKSEKKEKKEKKQKHTEDGVKKSKKEKKEKRKSSGDVTEALNEALEDEAVKPVAVEGKEVDEDGDVDMEPKVNGEKHIVGALVPFANPLADDKQAKKVFKCVKKSAKSKTLKRGVKEVVKALRKSTITAPTSSVVTDPLGVVVIAADISPMDVISHLPVLCEDHNIPYIYVTSRAELGMAGGAKRPTSVVMVSKERAAKKEAEIDAGEKKDFQEAYADLVKLVVKAGKSVKV